MRLMVGGDGRATVEYPRDCKRSYTDAVTYTIVPARCEDNDRKQDERSRQEDARQNGAQGQPRQGVTVSGNNGSLWAQLGIFDGAASIEQAGDPVAPYHPVGR